MTIDRIRRACVPLGIGWLASLCLGLLAVSFPHSLAAEERRLAFVVGIGNYDHLRPQDQLLNPVSDARAIEGAFDDLGYEVSAHTDLTRNDFDDHFTDFVESVREGDTVVLFLSGHGIEIDAENYLLPRDVPLMQAGDLLTKMRRRSISVAGLLDDLRFLNPKRIIMILDACREHPLKPSTFGKATTVGAGIIAEQGQADEFLMYAARTGQRAWDRLDDDDRIEHSVYVRHLLPLIGMPGMTVDELAKRLSEEVQTATRTFGKRQTPVAMNQLADEFCFAGCDVEEPAPDRSDPGLVATPFDERLTRSLGEKDRDNAVGEDGFIDIPLVGGL